MSLSRVGCQVRFTPITGLVFRDARPFQAGVVSVARNLPFPPPPAPFWFAAREALSQRRHAGGIHHLEARGHCLVRTTGGLEQRLFPCPLDLVQRRGESTWSLIAPLANKAPVAVSSALARYRSDRAVPPWDAGPLFAWPEGEHQATEGSLMTSPQWGNYLRMAGAPTEPLTIGSALPAASLFRNEVRTGTQLEQRRAMSGRLFSEQLLHLNPGVHFETGIEFESRAEVSLPRDLCVPLGGEAKLAHVQFERVEAWNGGFDDEMKNASKQAILRADPDSQTPLRVKLCLLTPLIGGANLAMLRRYASTPAWRPPWLTSAWTSDDRLPRPWWLGRRRASGVARYDVRLVASMTGKAYALGAWDSGSDRSRGGAGPRPLYRCLPAGAVYFLEVRPRAGTSRQEVIDDVYERVWLRSLLVTRSGRLTFFGRMGFGVVVAGGWSYAR